MRAVKLSPLDAKEPAISVVKNKIVKNAALIRARKDLKAPMLNRNIKYSAIIRFQSSM